MSQKKAKRARRAARIDLSRWVWVQRLVNQRFGVKENSPEMRAFLAPLFLATPEGLALHERLERVERGMEQASHSFEELRKKYRESPEYRERHPEAFAAVH